MRQIILASSSPRRRKFISDLFGKNYVVHPSSYVEKNNLKMDPVKLAEKHAQGKARDVSRHFNEGIVIAADSFVVFNDKVLGKPKDEKDAFNMLKIQSGKDIKVISGLCVIDVGSKKEFLTHEITRLKMNAMTDKEILAYIKTGDPMDKAGAFGMQDKGTIFVKKVFGCYSNVVGLPLPKLYNILKKIGIEIFDY